MGGGGRHGQKAGAHGEFPAVSVFGVHCGLSRSTPSLIAVHYRYPVPIIEPTVPINRLC